MHEDACVAVSEKVGMQRVRGGGITDRVDLEVSAGGMWSGYGGTGRGVGWGGALWPELHIRLS